MARSGAALTNPLYLARIAKKDERGRSMTVIGLARKAKVDKTTIYRLEGMSGRFNIPTALVASSIADAVGYVGGGEALMTALEQWDSNRKS